MPQKVRSFNRLEFPTSSSIPNSPANSRSLIGVMVADQEGHAKTPRFFEGFFARFYLPAGISVVATGFRFAFCNTALASAKSLF